jgi:dipeptide/tripeptide permease
VAVASAGTSIGGAIGVIGLGFLAVGALRGTRRAVTLGALIAFGGVVAAGAMGAGPVPMVIGTAAAVLAWDLGEQAINLGEQLGRAARTRNAELVHAANSTLIGVIGIAVGYGLFLVAAGGQPVTALVVLLAGALLIATALRG